MLVKYHLQVGSTRNAFEMLLLLFPLLISFLLFFFGFELLFGGQDNGESNQGKCT